MADSPRSILARLEQLKQWQEQQQRVLLEKHIAQQQLLEREQRKMYEVLGLQNATEGESYQESSDDSDSEPEYEETNLQVQVASELFKPTSANRESAMFDSDQEYPSAEPEDALKKQSNIPKRPFLKRGEGLRARFKVDPDKFKLNNLPTYKFAHHNRERNNRKNRSKQESVPEIEGKHTANSSQPASKESRPTTKQKDSGLQPKVEKKPRHKSDAGIVLDVNRVQDKRLKSTRRQGGSLPQIVNNDLNIEMQANEDNNLIHFAKQSSLEHEKEKHNTGGPSDAPWKRRLDPSVAPVVSKEQRDLNFFELLEQKVVGKNFNPDSSSILRFISANDTTANDETLANDDTVSNQAVGGPLIRPDECQTMGGLAPAPSDVPIDDATDDSEESDEEDEHAHVRFVDDGKSVSGNTSDVTDNESYMLKGVTLSKMSTPNDKFGHRSQSLEQAAQDNDVNESDDTSECGEEECSTADNPDDQSEGEETVTKVGDGDDTLRNEILAKSELLKERLAELEREIDSYRRENAELIRAKQEHEIERQNLQQDREEMEERMNDERIKMEVYFHDERMKIEAERKQALKEAQKPNKKDREEILRLNEELAEAKKQQKERELKHSASLARFRAQVKNMEKDLQETRLELEVAKKDNRRLETENARLKRQNNSRMLVEINRNIAKLATGGGAEAEERGRKKNSLSPEKAKVGPKMEGKVKSHPVHVTERKVSQVRAKVTSHLPPARTAGQRQSQAKRLPVGGNDLSMDSDENEENIPKSKHRPVAEKVNVLSDSGDDEDDTEEELSESSSSVAEPQPSSYFAKRSVRKTLFDAVNVDKDHEQPKQGLVRRESPPRNDRTPEASEIVKNLKREIVNADGSRDIWYPNGNLKKISPDGMTIRMLYFNKDIKETNMAEGTTKYYYSETNTWHTTYLDGLEILEFPDGQTEHRFKDGSTEVHFPNGSIRTTNPNSADIAEEWKYPDGTAVIIRKNEDKEISLPNGQVEIHTKAHKRRIYPDGTVKFVYPDGSQESRYSNGRIRLKDKDGRLISDTGGEMLNSALR